MGNEDSKKLEAIIAKLKANVEGAIAGEEVSLGDTVLTVDRSKIHHLLGFLKSEGFDLLLDIAGVDRLGLGRKERFEVIYILYSIEDNLRIRLKTFVPENNLELPTATGLWKAANWAEREVFDMFGIKFIGHPNLKRILCHHEFQGHALRKDYPIMKGQWCSSTRDMREDLDREP